MSDAIIQHFLKSEKLIIPYTVVRNVKDVSMIICIENGKYAAYNFDDYDEGPLILVRSQTSLENIHTFINDENSKYVSLCPNLIRVTYVYSISQNSFIKSINEIDLIDKNEQLIQLNRDEAIYPYSLALKDTINKG